MAPSLRHNPPPRPLPHAQHTFPWIRAVEFPSVHMEQEEPGDEAEFPGFAGFHGAISALGPDGVLVGVTRNCAER